jgi:hypothetical protein
MPYVPRPATTASCAHCGTSYESRHLRRKYCSNSCNVLASHERNGRPTSTRPTKADLEQMLATMMKLVNPKPKPAAKAAATKPAAKALTKKPAAKAAVKPTVEVALTAAKAAAIEKARKKAKFALLALATLEEEPRQDNYQGVDQREVYRR